MVPLFWNGVVEEGVASWSTDLDFLLEGNFKKERRVVAIQAIFWSKSAQDEVVLNISALYTDQALGVKYGM